MSTHVSTRRFGALLVVAATLALSACSNTYGPPIPGQPLTWGQQHYVDNERKVQDHDSRRSDSSNSSFSRH